MTPVQLFRGSSVYGRRTRGWESYVTLYLLKEHPAITKAIHNQVRGDSA